MSLGLNLEDSSNAPPGAFTTSTNPPTPTVSSERGRAGSLNSMIPVAPTPTPGGGGAHNTQQQQHFIGGEHPQVSEIRRKWGLSPVTSPHHHPNPPNGGILLAPGRSGSFDGSLATYSNATSFVDSDGGAGPSSLSETMTGVSQPLTTPTGRSRATASTMPSASSTATTSATSL